MAMLYPIRVQASTRDDTIQIIDTILIDPHCLPVTPSTSLSVSSLSSSSNSPSSSGTTGSTCSLQKQTISENAQYLANTLLADMEVHKVSKTNKSGRIKLLASQGLVQDVETQIASQLEIIIVKDREQKRRQKQQRINACKKRRLVKDEGKTDSGSDLLKMGNEKCDGGDDDDADVHMEEVDANKEDGPENIKISNADKVNSGKPELNEINNKATSEVEEEKKDNIDLVPIKIRLKEDGICIVDEFQVDPNHPLSNPILLATQLAKDLNLPPHLINSIAISIAEQICGFNAAKEEEREGIKGLTMMDRSGNNVNVVAKNTAMTAAAAALQNVSKRVQVDHKVPSAWNMDDKEQEAAKAHYVKVGTNHHSGVVEGTATTTRATTPTTTAAAAAASGVIGNIVS